MRQPRHEQQAVVAEERHPCVGLGIGLGQGADQRVARIAEPLAPGGMKPGDQLAGVALDARRDAAAVIVDEVHHQQVRLGMMDERDGEIRQPRKLAQHERLKLEARLRRSLLAAPSPPAAARRRADLQPGQPEPDRQRRPPRPRASRAFASSRVLSAPPIIALAVNPAARDVTHLQQNHFNSAAIVSDKRGEDDVLHEPGVRRYRALFISDLHLGTKACQAEAFLDFLRCHDASQFYLIGDIVDFWRIKRGIYWPQSHNDVLQKLLRKVRKGTDLVFIPGNHDEAMRDYCGMNFGGIAIERNIIHVGADGRRYLIMHGDEFDVVVRYAKWLALFGDWSYMLALWANTHFNVIRRWFGMPYWSLSAYLKQKVKRAVNYIGEFETALAQEARRHGAQGVICGHIHHAAMRQVGDVIYINTGDWVESCTAVAETEEGVFEIIRWTHPHPGHEYAPTSCPGARGCRLMRVLVATDAWAPQVNGVVRTYERLALEAPALGFEVSFLAPPLFRTLPCPTYPEIRLSLASPRRDRAAISSACVPISSISPRRDPSAT